MMSNKTEIKRMIQNEIQSISNLEERRVFKALMEGVFLSLYETNEHMYQELEHRITDELPYDVNHYLIRTGVVEKQYLDRSHHLMHPMDEMDLAEKQYKMSEIIKAVRQDGEFELLTVMIRCDYLQFQEIWNSQQQMKATLITDREWDITVKMRPNTRYLQHINHLYKLFVRNGIPWQTVNAPYLYKMADVVLSQLPEEIKESSEIKSIRIDFGQYSKFICYDYIPVWNVRSIMADTVGFPKPCGNYKNYEYLLSLGQDDKSHACLIDDAEVERITQRGNRISVISSREAVQRWQVMVIQSGKNNKIDRYSYPLMQNLRVDDFVEKYQRQCGQTVKTRAELVRFIRGFGMDDYLEYQGCKLISEAEVMIETYDMNSFIEDEIRDRRGAKKLILYFKMGKEERWLVRDIASFIVSEVQRIYPEYECGGVMV